MCIEWVRCAEVGGTEGVWGVATLCGARGGQLHAEGGEHRLDSHLLHPDPGWRYEPTAGQVPGGWRHTGSPEQWEPSGLYHCEWIRGVFIKPAMELHHKECSITMDGGKSDPIPALSIHSYCTCRITLYIVSALKPSYPYKMSLPSELTLTLQC